ncbi:MAG TPA: ribosome small subunit-dependent GTPase A [Phycisphaerae bacterium]|nr:ribosome small subunit-dependent GTPase A [Phycisphaerae bacterium]HRY68601.1 ribosome small subunit-dependent GTPase A [Phycisphaerae bacterium]HSA25650.1 ribosome small subunit-dependent GTPase A [Phycisphaerae bacterium]
MGRKPPSRGGGDKRRVDFRPNRQRPGRRKQWHPPAEQDNRHDQVAPFSESVQARGDLSRKRTIIEQGGDVPDGSLAEGIAVAVRGQFVDVDDGQCVWPCTVRRILRTMSIRDRHPVVAGDRVWFAVVADSQGQLKEGVIVRVAPRRTSLTRSDGRKTHVIAANVDQALIVSSIREPVLKPHLIDRYLVACHAGNLTAIICVNKCDLDTEGETNEIVDRYRCLGYAAIATSAATGQGLQELRTLLAGKATLLAGQSGVGKSSLVNAIQPSLNLPTAAVSATTEKGRHTTTTAVWLKLDIGGAVIDTPGIRALDVAMIPLNELETHFVEFVDRLQHCRFPNCVHIHEEGCAIQEAVDAGEVDPSRYDSYVELFYELSETRKSRYE